MRRIGEMAQADPSLTSRQPWKAVADKDHGWLNDAIVKHYEGDDSDAPCIDGSVCEGSRTASDSSWTLF